MAPKDEHDGRVTEQITFRVTTAAAKQLRAMAAADRGANRPSHHDIARKIVLDRISGGKA